MITPGSSAEIKSFTCSPDSIKQRRRLECLTYAILASILGLAWQATLVHSLYGGNWSALFYHGSEGRGLPDEPAFAGTYLFQKDIGFDGQYYRIVAHDPFRTRDNLRYLDIPVMRYRRILVPALAYGLACGRQPYIDAGFIATILLFLFLGVYWLARYAVLCDRTAKWGWAFLLAPATLAGLERGAVDTVLTSLTIGFAVYLREQSRYCLLLVLVAAGLCRETGLCLALACAAVSFLKKDWKGLILSWASTLPALGWYVFVQMRSPNSYSPTLLRLPLTDLVQTMIHHDVSYIKFGAFFVQFAYYAAVCGMLLAFFLSIWLSSKGWTGADGLAALAFTMIGLLLQPPGLWLQPYHFGRVLAPLLVLLGLEYFRTDEWWKALPVCLVSPAILLVSVASAVRVLKHSI
jgi:hypothetical protein